MEVWVVVEGQTEEQFIKRVVAPALRPLRLFLKPLLLKTSQEGRGGAISIDRLRFNLRNALRGSPDAVLTTFLDLYGLDTGFPGFAASLALADPLARAAYLESALHADIVAQVGCRPERFIAHIQPYEFEGLLFADAARLAQAEAGWSLQVAQLAQIRAQFPSPEHINDGYETKPSRRLETVLNPAYRKTRHGPLAAEHVGLVAMENTCGHFRIWMNQLRSLAG